MFNTNIKMKGKERVKSIKWPNQVEYQSIVKRVIAQFGLQITFVLESLSRYLEECRFMQALKIVERWLHHASCFLKSNSRKQRFHVSKQGIYTGRSK